MRRVVFIGSKELGFAVLKKMYELSPQTLQACITVDDSNDSRSYYNEFKEFCLKDNIQLYIINKAKMLNDIILKIQPEICFVVGWYFLIDQEIVNMVPGGFLGVHNSCLPKYRGFAPVVWSMINGESNCGFSLFSFSEKMDEGKIWVQREIEICENDYINDVLIKIQEKVEEVFEKYYLDILEQRIKPHAQKCIEPSYGGKRLPSDGKINWEWPAKRVYNFIKAQSIPYPGAYTTLRGDKVIIWRAHLSGTEFYGTPGQVGLINADGVYVVCGDNHVIILDFIEYGDKSGVANEIIKSLNCRLGRERDE